MSDARPSVVAYSPLRSDEYKRNADKGIADTACSLEMTRFYISEIVQALEYMHSKVELLVKLCLCVSLVPVGLTLCCVCIDVYRESSTVTLSLTTCS